MSSYLNEDNTYLTYIHPCDAPISSIGRLNVAVLAGSDYNSKTGPISTDHFKRVLKLHFQFKMCFSDGEESIDKYDHVFYIDTGIWKVKLQWFGCLIYKGRIT
jgi:hypothetical protein